MFTCFLLGTFNDVPGSDDKNFVVLGTYQTKDQAKAGVDNLAPAVMQGSYPNGITLYKLDHEGNKVYTFQERDLHAAYKKLQQQQIDQLNAQRDQLDQQQKQLQEQINKLSSGTQDSNGSQPALPPATAGVVPPAAATPPQA